MITLPQQLKLAILIDAENGVSPDTTSLILTSLHSSALSQSRVNVEIRRAYGNWFSKSLQAWQSVLIEKGIEPICSLLAKSNDVPDGLRPIKNAADMRLVIDAMELLLLEKFDYFCIVSSDRDFTPLVHRLKQAGATVIGYGRASTSATLKNAYHHFIELEKLEEKPDSKTSPPALQVISGSGTTSKTAQEANQPQLSQKQIKRLFQEACQHCTAKAGWLTVKDFQSQLQTICSKQKLKFSCKLFGCKKMEQLINKLGGIEWDAEQKATTALPNKRFKLKQAA